MRTKVKKVKSPIANGIKLPLTHIESMVINVTLPNGMVVTNPEQFMDEQSESMTEYTEETMAP